MVALDLLAQLTNLGVRFVFFDMKGELEDDPNTAATQRKSRTKFLEQTRARYVRLIQQDLPINPLTRLLRTTHRLADLLETFHNLVPHLFAANRVPQAAPDAGHLIGKRAVGI